MNVVSNGGQVYLVTYLVILGNMVDYINIAGNHPCQQDDARGSCCRSRDQIRNID